MNTIFGTFLFTIATHETAFLVDHHHLGRGVIKSKTGDGTCVDASSALYANGLVQQDLQHLLSYLQTKFAELKMGIF